MSDDKYIAYVGTHTHGTSNGIEIYDVDTVHGGLKFRKEVPVNNPSHIKVSGSQKTLYSIADEGIIAFRILPDGDLEEINRIWTGGMRGTHLAISADKRFLACAGYHDGSVTLIKLSTETGELLEVTDKIYHNAMGRCIAMRSSRPHVNCVRFTPDGEYLCAVDGGLDRVEVYKVDYTTGKLTQTVTVRGQLDSAPKSMNFSNDGRFAYLICELLNCIDVFKYSLVNGKPEFKLIQVVPTCSEVDFKQCSAIGLYKSRDDSHIFATNAGINTALVFDRDENTGLLTKICDCKVSGQFPKVIRSYPGDEYMLTLNYDSSEICTFKICYDKGYFLMSGTPVKIDKPNVVTFLKLDK